MLRHHYAVLFASVAVCLLTVGVSSQLPPQVDATKEVSNRGLGFEIGVKFRERIAQGLKDSPTLNQQLLPFYNTTSGRAHVESWLKAAQTTFPHLVQELEGTAAGAGQPVHIIALINMEDEIQGLTSDLLSNREAQDHCSDIYYVDPGTTNRKNILAHNEDARAYVKNTAYMVRAKLVDGEPKLRSNFLEYTYPGVLSGNAFGFNAHGMIFTCNAVFPTKVYTDAEAIPRNFITRAILDTHSLNEVRELLSRVKLASGFSLNVGNIHTGELSNFEMNGKIWKETVAPKGNSSHFNMYKHLQVSQHTDDSTVHRQQRCDELPSASDLTSIQDILGDTLDAVYPIYRDGTAPDCCATVASGFFDFAARKFSLYDKNPKLYSAPGRVYSMSL